MTFRRQEVWLQVQAIEFGDLFEVHDLLATCTTFHYIVRYGKEVWSSLARQFFRGGCEDLLVNFLANVRHILPRPPITLNHPGQCRLEWQHLGGKPVVERRSIDHGLTCPPPSEGCLFNKTT